MAATLITIAATACPATAETVTLTPLEDTFISEHFGGQNGSSANLIAGVQGASAGFAINRALLKFDLRSIPSNAEVRSVSLRLNVVRAAPGPASNFDLHRMLVHWDERTATWSLRAGPGQPWSAPGGAAGVDFANAISASQNIGGVAAYTFASTPGLAADVARWLERPDENQGWLVKTRDETVGFTARRFASAGVAALAPTLIIEFATNAVTSPPPMVVAVRHNDRLIRLQFRAEAGNTYSVEAREDVETGAWDLVTNITAKLADFDAFAFDSLTNRNQRFYRLSRVPCNCD